MKPNNFFLVGPMGAGKTTLGRQLAQRLGLDFLDVDHELQTLTGVDIPTIFAFEGEAGFRARERDLIDKLSQRNGIVLATGGGAVLHPDNRRHLSSRGLVIYLSCSPKQQFERTRYDRNRPLLQTQDPLTTLKTLFAERDPLYREVADIIIQTERQSTARVLAAILKQLAGPEGQDAAGESGLH
jgi:shikimate kinase